MASLLLEVLLISDNSELFNNRVKFFNEVKCLFSSDIWKLNLEGDLFQLSILKV